MRSKLLKKQGTTTAPAVTKMSREEMEELLFVTDAQEEVYLQQAIDEDDRGETISWEESTARIKRKYDALEVESIRKLQQR